MCELLWSDPHPGEGRTPSKRGVGVAFGSDVTRSFLQSNKLDLLVRSHEVPLLGARAVDFDLRLSCFSFREVCLSFRHQRKTVKPELEEVPHLQLLLLLAE